MQIVCASGLWRPCTDDQIQQRARHVRNPVAASFSIDHDGDAGLHVVATGAEANSLLEVVYAGRDRVLLIKPSWVQRALASSTLLAASLLFPLLAPIVLLRRYRKPADD